MRGQPLVGQHRLAGSALPALQGRRTWGVEQGETVAIASKHGAVARHRPGG